MYSETLQPKGPTKSDKKEIVKTDDVTVRIDAKALAIKATTMVVATAASMAAVHLVQKAIRNRQEG